MPNELTRNDLESYQRANEQASERVIGILREVAVQFNTIAIQLVQLAKSNEELLTTLLDRVYRPLDVGMHEQMQFCHAERIYWKDQLPKIIDDIINPTENLTNKVVDKINSITTAVSTLDRKMDQMEKDSIKARTLWIMVIGAITSAAGLVAAFMKFV